MKEARFLFVGVGRIYSWETVDHSGPQGKIWQQNRFGSGSFR
jgi:hypothetical protein